MIFSVCNLPTISSGQDKVLPPGMFAYQQVGVRGICTPAHGFIDKLALSEGRQESPKRLAYRHFGCVRISIAGMLGVGSRGGNAYRLCAAKRLMHLEAGEAGELVAYLNYPVPAC